MATTPASTEQKPKVDLGILEEDDEFEEFPTEGTKISGRHSLLVSPLVS